MPRRTQACRVAQTQRVATTGVGVSPTEYNRRVGLALLCPSTSRVKGYPFEVTIPNGLKVLGTVLSDQVKPLNWRTRNATFICRLPAPVLRETLGKLATLLQA